MLTRPAVDRFETVVVLGAVKDRTEGVFPSVKRINGFEQVIGCDLPEGQFFFAAGTFDHLHEVHVVFPVPRKAEVIVHDFNYKRMV